MSNPIDLPGSEDSGPVNRGQRLAKLISRSGIESRRGAERLIEAGRVKVNGAVVHSPATNVTQRDRIAVDGQILPQVEPSRLWLHYKPRGLVTTARDEKGRDTVFDRLPSGLPRLMPVGRLDLSSEGLLLLTNDGELKSWLEHPSTGWMRKYRVRAFGNPDTAWFEDLKKGVRIDGQPMGPMTIDIDSRSKNNTWFTIGLRQGRNREIRRAMEAAGMMVNRLIRISYGPFRLGQLKPGDVTEVRRKVLRDQIGHMTPVAMAQKVRTGRNAYPRQEKQRHRRRS